MTAEFLAGVNLRDYAQRDLAGLFPMVQDLYTDPGDAPRTLATLQATLAEATAYPEKLAVKSITLGEKLVGYCIFVFFWSHEFGGNILELDELYLLPEHRNRGIGRALLQALPGLYPECVGFTLCSNTGNARAQALYQSVGYTPSPFVHMLRLRDQQTE